MAVREETIQIKLVLDYAAAVRHRKHTKVLGVDCEVRRGDTAKIDYRFCASYFGDTAAKLDAVCGMLVDPKIVREASISELEYRRSIVVDVVQKLTRIIDQLKEESDGSQTKG